MDFDLRKDIINELGKDFSYMSETINEYSYIVANFERLKETMIEKGVSPQDMFAEIMNRLEIFNASLSNQINLIASGDISEFTAVADILQRSRFKIHDPESILNSPEAIAEFRAKFCFKFLENLFMELSDSISQKSPDILPFAKKILSRSLAS